MLTHDSRNRPKCRFIDEYFSRYGQAKNEESPASPERCFLRNILVQVPRLSNPGRTVSFDFSLSLG